MLWQIKNANGGDYLILRGSDIGQTEDLDGWMNPVIYSLALREGCALSSVRTVQFLSREASTNAQVLAYIAGTFLNYHHHHHHHQHHHHHHHCIV